MARQKQRESKNGHTENRQDDFTEALNATHQHSVPVLPANTAAPFGGPGDSPLSASSSTTRGTQVRRTLADTGSPTSKRTVQRRAATLGDATGSSAAASSGRMHAPDPAGAGPMYSDDVDTYEDRALVLGGVVSPVSHAAGAERLPAVLENTGSRELAVRDEGQPAALFIRGAARPLRPYATIVPKRKGPRSFLTQFVVSMMSVMILFSVLALASPLSKSAPITRTFQAYANAAPWVPTPTPTPMPTATPTPIPVYIPPAGQNPGAQAIVSEIQAVFGQYAQGALNIANCESGYDPNAVNPYAIGNSHASGVFQILYPSTWDTTSYAASSPFDYNANIHAAYQIFSRDGYTWVEWACKSY